jgi:hypothetical protein
MCKVWALSALSPRPTVVYFASPSLVIPLIVPHYKYTAGFYTWWRRNCHLVPWNIGPGDGISNEIDPHIHTGYVWPFEFFPTPVICVWLLLSPSLKRCPFRWQCPVSCPTTHRSWFLFSFNNSFALLAKVLAWIPLLVWVQLRISSISYGWELSSPCLPFWRLPWRCHSIFNIFWTGVQHQS